uniref:Uncharacterized protein LOC108949781 n=1 Tax=Phallusia mammillata TaxID=59560 RepID=A0A6F9DIG8_9ASCI|nr:uncharacterized protein LOC108949781 [Phallusia mammillata]
MCQIKDFKAVARNVERKTLRATVRAYVRTIMRKELAMKYSWSGLGPGRKATKRAYRDSKAYAIMITCLSYTCHKNASTEDIISEVKTVFSQVPDWDGGRNKRNLPADSSDSSFSSESTLPMSDSE